MLKRLAERGRPEWYSRGNAVPVNTGCWVSGGIIKFYCEMHR